VKGKRNSLRSSVQPPFTSGSDHRWIWIDSILFFPYPKVLRSNPPFIPPPPLFFEFLRVPRSPLPKVPFMKRFRKTVFLVFFFLFLRVKLFPPFLSLKFLFLSESSSPPLSHANCRFFINKRSPLETLFSGSSAELF